MTAPWNCGGTYFNILPIHNDVFICSGGEHMCCLSNFITYKTTVMNKDNTIVTANMFPFVVWNSFLQVAEIYLQKLESF